MRFGNYFVANPSFLSLLVLILSTIHPLQALIRLYAVVEADKVIVPAIVQAPIFERQRSSGHARAARQQRERDGLAKVQRVTLPLAFHLGDDVRSSRAIRLRRLNDGGADGT
jgi:hypothetical protein